MALENVGMETYRHFLFFALPFLSFFFSLS